MLFVLLVGATWPGAEGADESGAIVIAIVFVFVFVIVFVLLVGATWPDAEGAGESGELGFLLFGL